MVVRDEEVSITHVTWPDAHIKRIEIDFDELVIEVINEFSTRETHAWCIRCRGYIGYSWVGLWDDMIVQEAELLDTSDLQRSCLQSIMHSYGPVLHDSGNAARNSGSYQTLSIKIIDGAVFNIVAAEFAVSYRAPH